MFPNHFCLNNLLDTVLKCQSNCKWSDYSLIGRQNFLLIFCMKIVMDQIRILKFVKVMPHMYITRQLQGVFLCIAFKKNNAFHDPRISATGVVSLISICLLFLTLQFHFFLRSYMCELFMHFKIPGSQVPDSDCQNSQVLPV